MTTPLAFLPRAVSKSAKEWQGISRPPPSPSPPPDPTTDDEDDDEKLDGKAIETGHPKHSTIAQDIAYLISLALSDYNIWCDPDLCSKLDACLQEDTSPEEAAFVPINYLLRRIPFRGSLPLASGQPELTETEVVKALRAHASHAFEVRMRLSSSSSVWYGTGKTSRKKDVGGYEVRRRDWVALRDRPSRGWTRARWDDMTAYLECIPPQYRTVGGIARFIESLLLDVDADAGPRLRVLCVTLPPHYLDKPGDVPKCRGYALVTFSTKSDLGTVLGAWPWKRRRVPDDDENASPIVKEAHKYGLRAISKSRWDALNEEYLVYKQSLVEEVTRAETVMQDLEHGEPTALPHSRPPMQTQTAPSSSYPFDCLVFVRNVHTDTNKTVLRSFFAQAFQDQSLAEIGLGQGHGRGDAPTTAGLDYVDFNRGTDTCYLRLASPDYAARLVVYFEARPTVQTHGLDTTGRTPPLEGDKPCAVEMVRGKKEEVYWEKIPEKVRRQAVDKIVRARLASGAAELESETASAPVSSLTRYDGVSGSGRRKRARAC